MGIYKRYPFYVLDYDKANTSINKEIMYDGSNLYLNVSNNIIKASDSTVNQTVDNISKILYGSMSGKYESIDEMIEAYNKSKIKVNKIKDGDPSTGTLDIISILDKFKGLDTKMNLNKYTNSLANIGDSSGVLSDNDFTNELKSKIDRAEFGAKKYTHPTKKQCNYISPVQSVFGRTGNVIVTKSDFGLENIDPNANNYMHPRMIQCKVDYVKSVNNIKLADVKFSKGTIDLGTVDNAYPSRSKANIKDRVDDQYLVYNSNTKEYLDEEIAKIKAIPKVDNVCKLTVSVKNEPDPSNPMYMLTVVTIYARELDISRKYTPSPTHEFDVIPGKYIIKVEGYNNNTHIIRTKQIDIYEDKDLIINLEKE